MYFGQEMTSDFMSLSVHCIRRYMISVCLMEDSNFDPLVKVSPCKMITLCFRVSNPGGLYFETK